MMKKKKYLLKLLAGTHTENKKFFQFVKGGADVQLLSDRPLHKLFKNKFELLDTQMVKEGAKSDPVFVKAPVAASAEPVDSDDEDSDDDSDNSDSDEEEEDESDDEDDDSDGDADEIAGAFQTVQREGNKWDVVVVVDGEEKKVVNPKPLSRRKARKLADELNSEG